MIYVATGTAAIGPRAAAGPLQNRFASMASGGLLELALFIASSGLVALVLCGIAAGALQR